MTERPDKMIDDNLNDTTAIFNRLMQRNWTGPLLPELAKLGWETDLLTGKIACTSRLICGLDQNWIFVNPVPESMCKIYQTIVGTLKFVPSPCLDCWKIVVHPRTVSELIDVYKMQLEWTKDCIGKDKFCKCGTEARAWVPHNYGAYFYTTGKKQGLYRYKQVREKVDKINPQIPVILKRYCTEFEINLGPTDKYEWTDSISEVNDEIMAYIDEASFPGNIPTPANHRRHTMSEWLKFAWSIGDFTCLLFNKNEPIYPRLVTYHEVTHAVDKELPEFTNKEEANDG